MLHTKLIDATLAVANPVEFCTNKEKNALKQLKRIYERKCFKACYIIKIDEITRCSSCRIVMSNMKAEGAIDVEFKATVAIIACWDIIPNVRIVRTEGMIVGTTKGAKQKEAKSKKRENKGDGAEPVTIEYGDPRDAAAAVIVLGNDASKSVRVGQTIPIRVRGVEHQPMAGEISMLGVMLTCDTAPQASFRVGTKGTLDQKTATAMMPIVTAIDKIMVTRKESAKSQRSALMLFETLLYAYRQSPPKGSASGVQSSSDVHTITSEKGSPEWVGPLEIKTKSTDTIVNILDIVKQAAGGEEYPMAGYWSRPLHIYRSCPVAAFSKEKPKGGTVVDIPAAILLNTFLKSILEYLFAVQSMIDTYSTDEILKDHENIWAAMRAAQLPAK